MKRLDKWMYKQGGFFFRVWFEFKVLPGMEDYDITDQKGFIVRRPISKILKSIVSEIIKYFIPSTDTTND